MNTSESTKWLKQYLYTDIDSDEYTEVRNFMLLWNLFEAQLFEGDFGGNRDRINVIRLEQNLIDEIWPYLRNRYITDNATNFRFEALKLRNNDKPEKVKRILLENADTTPSDIIETITTIIYRYRNNLFHGTKKIASLPQQKENFVLANKFLMACLDES